jgi:hypothetical protein
VPKRARNTPPAAEISHISPEEAVAHIQALLRAKQERVKQGPHWPGAKSEPNAVNGHVSHGDNQGSGPQRHLTHARGDQVKGNKS